MGHPTFSFSLLSPKLHQVGRGGGDSLCTAWPPRALTPRGYYRSLRQFLAWRTNRAGGGRNARCAVTLIPSWARGPGSQACWLVRARPHLRLPSTYFALIRRSCLPLRSRSWPQTLGRRSRSPTLVLHDAKTFPLHFSRTSQSSPNSTRRGRMYSQSHFRCLEGAGPMHPAGFSGCALPGNREGSWVARPERPDPTTQPC